jgi:hypothetical protein
MIEFHYGFSITNADPNSIAPTHPTLNELASLDQNSDRDEKGVQDTRLLLQ